MNERDLNKITERLRSIDIPITEPIYDQSTAYDDRI